VLALHAEHLKLFCPSEVAYEAPRSPIVGRCAGQKSDRPEVAKKRANKAVWAAAELVHWKDQPRAG